MIPEADKEYLRERFKRELTGRVRIDLFTQREAGIIVPGREPCRFCKPVQEALGELSGLSSKVRLTVHDFHEQPATARQFGVERIPCTVVRGPSGRPFKFYGLFSGAEFPAFVEGLIVASRGTTALSRETKERLRTLREDVLVQLFVTPSCPHCPRMTFMLAQMVQESHHVKAEMVEATEFLQLAQRYGIKGVPAAVINHAGIVLGAQPEAEFVEQIVRAAEHRPAAVTGSGPTQPIGVPPAPPSGGLYIPGR